MAYSSDQSKEITYKIHKAVFLLDKMSDQILQHQLGLGFSQFLVMMTLAHQPNVPQKFVASALDQTQAAVSRQVDILVDLRLISRETNVESRREYVLCLTKLGEKMYRKGLKAIDERFDGLFNVWTKNQKSELLNALEQLIIEIKFKGTENICGKVEKS